MLDYQQLIAPARHGGVLVAPDPSSCARLVRENAAALDASTIQVSGSTLGELRKETRARLLRGGGAPVIMAGHQPEFIHAGVWAKNLIVHRLAQALEGVAVHLVVDSDAPKRLSLRIPVTSNERMTIREVQTGAIRPGCAYEQIPPLAESDLEEVKTEVAGLLGERFSASALPSYFAGMSGSRSDWVSQTVAGRRQIESDHGVELQDLRIRDAWWSPLAAHLLMDSGGFARAYNESIAEYRVQNKVRTANRPIPDLVSEGERIELPFWLYFDEQPRSRAFCAGDRDHVTLCTRFDPVVTLSREQIEKSDDVVELVRKESGWLLRPRALITTIWARLFLADLFIHGIGGSKYDRISDSIIRRYFRMTPPEIACVTATLYVEPDCEPEYGQPNYEHKLRDATWNPQRHFDLADSTELNSLLEQRKAAARLADKLRREHRQDRAGRKAAFELIHRLNEQIHALRPDLLNGPRMEMERRRRQRANLRVACDREYFFAMHPRSSLELLLDALPQVYDFV
jgi:hypothetical protein